MLNFVREIDCTKPGNLMPGEIFSRLSSQPWNVLLSRNVRHSRLNQYTFNDCILHYIGFGACIAFSNLAVLSQPFFIVSIDDIVALVIILFKLAVSLFTVEIYFSILSLFRLNNYI